MPIGGLAFIDFSSPEYNHSYHAECLWLLKFQSKLALYPTPLMVVGTMVNGKPNWTLEEHLGIID